MHVQEPCEPFSAAYEKEASRSQAVCESYERAETRNNGRVRLGAAVNPVLSLFQIYESDMYSLVNVEPSCPELCKGLL